MRKIRDFFTGLGMLLGIMYVPGTLPFALLWLLPRVCFLAALYILVNASTGWGWRP